jgi:hypothetical protein
LSQSASSDLFNLKYTTHVKPNRKGLIAHTAVSTGLNCPLGIIFERSKDTTLGCFRRLLDFLFSHDGQTNLRNVNIHSDRGYMIPNLVFDYLLSSGAEVVGTVKRMAQCWPFTYKQNLKENDKRTSVDPKGAPTLFLKWVKVGGKHLFASAFRNGSEAVATAVSSMHNQHQWEGIVLKNSELERYKTDDKSLLSDFFVRVSDIHGKTRARSSNTTDSLENDGGNHQEEIESEDEKEVIADLLSQKIDPITLRQGR